jgi:hypothetical protein
LCITRRIPPEILVPRRLRGSKCDLHSRGKPAGGGLCIADFFRSRSRVNSTCWDAAGDGRRARHEAAEKLRKANQYQDYLFLHGFGVESAEALAEYWHKYMRQELGFGSEDATQYRGPVPSGYRGSRYSFGYPACPNLEDRAKSSNCSMPGRSASNSARISCWCRNNPRMHWLCIIRRRSILMHKSIVSKCRSGGDEGSCQCSAGPIINRIDERVL